GAHDPRREPPAGATPTSVRRPRRARSLPDSLPVGDADRKDTTMNEVRLPDPVRRPPHRQPQLDVTALEAELRASGDGEVRFDAGTRGAYSTDASNYRQIPIGVVVPRSVEAAAVAVEICRRHNAPLLSRGGGTSLAGQCT